MSDMHAEGAKFHDLLPIENGDHLSLTGHGKDPISVGPWWSWSLIGAIALGIRLHARDRFSYWLDEILEVFRIQLGWGRMLQALRKEVLNPPLDYMIQKAFSVLDPSDAARRILPALWGSAFVVVVGFLVSRRATPRVGLVTALCLAFAPFHVHYSQEVRPYSLGLFLMAVTLLLVDRYLEKPHVGRLLGVVVSAVAVAYTLLLAAVILFLAGAALILDDALTGSEPRRAAARRLVLWSPALILAIALAYTPWLSLVWQSLGAPPMSVPPVFEIKRVARLFSVFGFGFHDWYPLGWPGGLFIALVLGGALLSVIKYRLRFLVVWAFGGASVIEGLEERHGVFDSIMHFLPAGIALTVLAAVPLGWLAASRRKWLAPLLLSLSLVVFLDVRALDFYFRRGRADWRPVATFLRSQARTVPIFTAGQYTQLSLGYYVNGPRWLCCPDPSNHRIIDIGNDASGLSKVWHCPQEGWLVSPTAAVLKDGLFLKGLPTSVYPTADMGVTVRRLGAPTLTLLPAE